mgnify:CR=1 FL=1
MEKRFLILICLFPFGCAPISPSYNGLPLTTYDVFTKYAIEEKENGFEITVFCSDPGYNLASCNNFLPCGNFIDTHSRVRQS